VQSARIPTHGWGIQDAVLVSPDTITGKKLLVQSTQDGVSMTIPSLDVYGLIMMNLA